MSNMNFNCDVCGREVQGINFVNGMKFCAKCYQDTFGETEKDRKIADLQSQLAEKDKEIERLNKLIKKLNNEAQKYYEDAYCNDCQNQKAIEQLEKVKTQCEFKISFACDEQEQRLYEFIDQQINELKGEQRC